MWHRDFHDAVIVECPDESLIGKSFGAIADERGLHPLDAFLDVLVENGERNVRWTTIVANHRPKLLNKLAAEPSVHMGFSDAGAHLRNMAFYNFRCGCSSAPGTPTGPARRSCPLERAVHRLTGELAEWFGIDAGTLRAGRPCGLRGDRPGRPQRRGRRLPRGRGSVLRRLAAHGQSQRRGRGRDRRRRRRRLPQTGQFREGYGQTVKSGRYLRAGARQRRSGRCAECRRLTMARTQQQRREETVGRLLEACIATIIEVGYARASAAVITKRAGVSVGALFRHFETMGDFMAATASEVLRRQLESFTKQVAEIPADRPALEAALTILRDITGSPTNAVLYELMIAARTDEKLNAHLRDVLGQYTAKIHDAARALPGRRGLPGGDVSGSGGVVDERVRRSRDGARDCCRNRISRSNELRC